MSAGCASVSKRSPTSRKTQGLDFTGLFDWIADQLRLATPENVIRAIMSADSGDFIEELGDRIPRRYYAETCQLKRMSASERARRAQAWFENIEPGYLRFHEPEV